MKILVLNYEYPPIGGGASPVSKDLCEQLAKRGNQVTVVTMRYKDLPKHENVNGVEIYRVNCLRTKKSVCSPLEQMTYIISAFLFLERYLKEEHFDINYTHFIIPTGVVSVLLKKKFALEYVITAHGSDVLGHNNKRFRFLYTILKKPWCYIVREARVVVAPSQYLLDLMKKSETNARFELIKNGIDTSVFVPDIKKKQILVMCRLQETKRVEDIINAISLLDLTGWHIQILGDGPQKQKLQTLVTEKKLEQYVDFRGWIENKSKEHLKILGETYIYISASELENCPISVLEAKCSGCRLVLSDIKAHRQLIDDENCFYKCGDILALSKKLQDEMRQYEGISQFNFEHEDYNEYDWKNVVDKYMLLMGIKK